MNYSRNNIISTDVEIIENETGQYSFKGFEEQEDSSGEIWSTATTTTTTTTDYPILVPEIQWNPRLMSDERMDQSLLRSDAPIIALPFYDHFSLLDTSKITTPLPEEEDEEEQQEPNRIDQAGEVEQQQPLPQPQALERSCVENADSKSKDKARKKTKNPFIAFFLSMYSRRPRRRVTDVARQAARQWSRMTDWRKKRIALRAGIENWRTAYESGSGHRRAGGGGSNKPKSSSSSSSSCGAPEREQ